MPVKKLTAYCGVPIQDLDRETLIEALEAAVEEIQWLRDSATQERQMQAMFRQMREARAVTA